MVQIYPKLYIGSLEDYKKLKEKDWAIVHAAKEPYHRQLLGYTGRSAPKEHPEYLIARRGDTLYLNLVDVPDPKYIADTIIDETLHFIHTCLQQRKNVLVHCNLGESRAPGIGLLYLRKIGILRGTNEEQVKQFKKLYPAYNPGKGIEEYINSHI